MWDITVPGDNDHDFYVRTVSGTHKYARHYNEHRQHQSREQRPPLTSLVSR
jgi:hypothetical protein